MAEIKMPLEVFEAAKVLIDEFMEVDYWERVKHFRQMNDQKEANKLEAAAKRYEDWLEAIRRLVPAPYRKKRGGFRTINHTQRRK